MIPVPMDDRCRCIQPSHKGPKDLNGQCLQKATHVTEDGVQICMDCAEEHYPRKKLTELKVA